MTKDSLGDRMKANYENRTRLLLPRRTYTIIRVDGKAFHTYTRDCERPYDAGLMEDMDRTALALCREVTGAQIAFIQSDEISLLLTDFAGTQTEAWFDNNLQKLVSLTASIATAHFNAARWQRAGGGSETSLACFDSRAFTIPDPVEVENYFLWRQQDATRNSVSMTAQAQFPHDQLQNKSSDQLQEMLWQEKKINWNDQPAGFKRGRCAVPQIIAQDKEYVDQHTGQAYVALGVVRRQWEVTVPPIFSQDRAWLRGFIPRLSSD